MTRLVAYAAYAIGSLAFLVVAAGRGQPLMATGSALFLLGTLTLLVPLARKRLRGRNRDSV